MGVVLNNNEIINAVQSISNILKVNGLPMKTNWNLVKNRKKLELSFKTYLECEQKLVQQYALKDENMNIRVNENNEPKFAPQQISEYLSKREELLNYEDTFDMLLINLSDLEGHGISGVDVYNLMFMIQDDTEPTESN